MILTGRPNDTGEITDIATNDETSKTGDTVKTNKPSETNQTAMWHWSVTQTGSPNNETGETNQTARWH